MTPNWRTAARTRDYRGKKYDDTRGVVHIHSTSRRVPAVLVDLIDEQTRVDEHDTLPVSADFLAVTTGGLSVERERMAARLNATPVVLPAAAEWFRRTIACRVEGGDDLTVVVYRAADHDIP